MFNLLHLYRRFGLLGVLIFIKTRILGLCRIKVPGILKPIDIRINTSDLSTFYQVFAKDQYGIHFKGEVKTVIDAGANIGLASVYFQINSRKQELLLSSLNCRILRC